VAIIDRVGLEGLTSLKRFDSTEMSFSLRLARQSSMHLDRHTNSCDEQNVSQPHEHQLCCYLVTCQTNG